MTKRETYLIMMTISVYYDQFEMDQQKVDAWHEVFKHYPFEPVKEKLFAFVAESPFPPKISDLVKKTAVVSREIPGAEATRALMQTQVKPASEEVIQRELANMRKILGIRRDA
ncbi:replicative helicase loader/inhibitor [Bacillus sp. T33-2]|uniref:replicative helicase loader/inhibitor n=1 Tax=Bacillus sp. T33-2 TaxID=2054168 RepID=UPI000C7949C6|nr:replicative helicase loader/inhibitor [Bacillus sp. T33-2]PLR95736.1 hypothetical protein CVD19_13435 [Bacillus sp. T33-2]